MEEKSQNLTSEPGPPTGGPIPSGAHDDLLDSGSSDRRPKHHLRWAILLVLAVGVFYVFIDSAMQGGAYFLEVDEAVAADLPSTRPIRVKGNVVAGTYRNPEGTKQHSFSIESGGNVALPIYYDGPIPDVFAEGREVVVEGIRRPDGTLVASVVTAKCPSKYEGGMSEQARQKLEGRN